MLPYYLTLLAGFLRVVACRQTPFWIDDDESEAPSETPLMALDGNEREYTAYSGITTFAHLPFVDCLYPRYTEETKEKFDIAIVGAPFDTAVTYRPG
jgi:agmatinase